MGAEREMVGLGGAGSGEMELGEVVPAAMV
jgi:hypothetical protein